MDFVSPILEIVNRLWDCCDKRAVFIRQLPENLKSLRDEMEELKNVYRDVKKRVEDEQKLQKEIKHVVTGWIRSVESMEGEVNEMLTKGEEEIKKKCLGTCCTCCTCCPRNCRASYELGKMVPKKINAVSQLCSKANNFQEVAAPLPTPPAIEVVAAPSPTLPVIELPLDNTVGLDSLSEEVWRCLQDDKVRTIGLYGMGGVGKTTLLKRINNEFLETSFEFDIVIWVVVSKPASVEKIQEMVLRQCDAPDNRWKGRSEDEKAKEIYNILKTRKFILLLDDIWEQLNLLKIGFPLNDQNMSKVIFTTRFLNVCEAMGAESIKVECLKFKDAFALFQSNVGEATFNSHPRIPKLAKIVVEECKGLPLALMIAGGAMKGKKTPQEWQKNIELLQSYPSKVPGMENDLFRVLALSYDNLSKPNVKSCFLYCSMFPEDWEISCKQLIELWIGEGFLGEWRHIHDARTNGEEIIEQLNASCLLESGQYEKHVKMHDVIRDMALWLACENGKKKNKCVIKEHGRWIEGHEIAEWKETQRMSLWDNSIEDSTEPPDFRNLETLLASGESMKSFPSQFFRHMSAIRVLDLSNSELMVLPAEIGNLKTLHYLNLSKTEIESLPMKLKNLTKLRCLILDDMEKLEAIPSQLISSLSSLQLFSLYASIGCNGDWGFLLEELACLKHVSDISIPLRSVLHTQKSVDSHKLGRSIRRLSLQDCTGMTTMELSPYLQILQIWRCFDLADVKINLGRGQEFSKLSEVEIIRCPKLLHLTCLAFAPNLLSLRVEYCESMQDVITEDEEIGISEVEQCSDAFSVLTTLSLSYLSNLRSICGGALSFPSLREITVKHCPRLRKLTFDSNTNCLRKIEGEQHWWDGLDWEDQTIKQKLTQYFVPK